MGVVELAIGLKNAFRGPYPQQFVAVANGMMPVCVSLGADYLHCNNIELDFLSGTYLQDGKPIPGLSMMCLVQGVSMGTTLTLSAGVATICVGTPDHHINFELQHDSSGDVMALKSLITSEQA